MAARGGAVAAGRHQSDGGSRGWPLWRRPPAWWWLVARSGAWLAFLPLSFHRRPLPDFLERITVRARRRPGSLTLDQSVRAVAGVCRLPVFHLPIFPRPCLRRSLTLYRMLIQTGHPVVFHLGVRNLDGTFHAHSWVTLNGRPLGEPAHDLRILYSYPPQSPETSPRPTS